jgi:hypothetical protein
MTMAGGTSRATQVRSWVAERAASLGVPVSIPVLCETAVLRLGVTGVTLTVDISSRWPETRHATDGLGARLAELQVIVGEGPCLDVWQEGGPVLVPDLDAPAIQLQWPLFATLAVEAGACALFALPMAVGTIRVGVLALHRSKSGQLESETLVDSLEFAHLAMRLQLDEQAGITAEKTSGLELYSPHVHQATGMISAQLDVGMDEAFSRLRARAFAEQRSLTELAAGVVARTIRFDPTNEAS